MDATSILLGSDDEAETMEVVVPASGSANEPQQVRTTRRKLHQMKLIPAPEGAQSPSHESVLSQDSQEEPAGEGSGGVVVEGGGLEDDETTMMALAGLCELPGENDGVEGAGAELSTMGEPSTNDALLDDAGDEGGLMMNVDELADQILDGHMDAAFQAATNGGQQVEIGGETANYRQDLNASDDEIQILPTSSSTPPYAKEEVEKSPSGGGNDDTEDDDCMIISHVNSSHRPATLKVEHEEPLPSTATYRSPQIITLADDDEGGQNEGRPATGSNDNEAAPIRHSSTDDVSSDESDSPLSVRSAVGEDEGLDIATQRERESEKAQPQRIDAWLSDGTTAMGQQPEQHEQPAIPNPEAERIGRIMSIATESQAGNEVNGETLGASTQPTDEGETVTLEAMGRQKVSQPTAVQAQSLRAKHRQRGQRFLKKQPLATIELDDTPVEMEPAGSTQADSVEIKAEVDAPEPTSEHSVAEGLDEPLNTANMDLVDSTECNMDICDTPTRAVGPSEQPTSPEHRPSGVEMEVEDAANHQSPQDQLDAPPRRPTRFGGGLDSTTIERMKQNPSTAHVRTGLDIRDILLPHHQSLSSPPRLSNMMPQGSGSGSEEVSPGEPIPVLGNRRQSRPDVRESQLQHAQAARLPPFNAPPPAVGPTFEQRFFNELQHLWPGQPLRMPPMPIGGAAYNRGPPSPVYFPHPPPPAGQIPPPPRYQVHTRAARNLLERQGTQVGPDGVIGGVQHPARHPLQRSRSIARSRSVVRFQDEDLAAQEEFANMPEMEIGGYHSDAGHRRTLHRTPSRGRRSLTPFRFPLSPQDANERHSGDEEIHRARSRSRPRRPASGRSRSRPRVPSGGSDALVTGANTEPIYFDPSRGTVRGEYDAVTIRNLNKFCNNRNVEAASTVAIGSVVAQLPHGVNTAPQFERRTPRCPQRGGPGGGAASESSSGGGLSPPRRGLPPRDRSMSPYRPNWRAPRGRSVTRRPIRRQESRSPPRRPAPTMRSRSRPLRSPVAARRSRERNAHRSRQPEHHSRPRRSDPTVHRRKRHHSQSSDDGSASSSDTDSVSSGELKRRLEAAKVDVKLFNAKKEQLALERKLAKKEKRAELQATNRDGTRVEDANMNGGDMTQRPGPSRRVNGGRPPSPKRRSTGDGQAPLPEREMRVTEVSEDDEDDCVVIPPQPRMIKQEQLEQAIARTTGRGRAARRVGPMLTAEEIDQRLGEYREASQAAEAAATTEQVEGQLASGLEQQTL